ncbi:spermine synthase [Roseimicrobium sp. ORNL1]|uniref:spermine/spermidine synthase domain-containing protein n=1 Tax=Roseimicrobium sp. ORNL1 TaxID=2711231 RepID=UPI0013EA856B|nr:spermine synthase [Roseimicrobium sp. ORNL1]
MTPFVTIAQARTPQGAELTLHSHGAHFYLRVNREPLMGTNAPESEKALAQCACAGLKGRKSVRVLIGGLGFGFSLRQTLELVGHHAKVEVAELLPEVVAWNRAFLKEVNGALLDDPRVKVTIEDVFQTVINAPAAHYDAILLDVDNGPVAMVQDGNARLYRARGLAAIIHALKPGGRATFWSATPDRQFGKELGKAGFVVDVVSAKSHAHARRHDHTIFVATRKEEAGKMMPADKRRGS